MKRGGFITLEGGEGVGKTTNLEFIRDYLVSKGMQVLVTREPGGVPVAETLRNLILAQRALLPEAELLLMFAARVHHFREKIAPSLSRGQWVISDRFTDASYAYQGGGRGIAWQRIGYLEDWLLEGCKPDLTLLFDAPVAVGLARAKARGETNRFEDEELAFMERVRQAYLKRWREDPERIRKIDATLPLSQVRLQLRQCLDTLVATWQR